MDDIERAVWELWYKGIRAQGVELLFSNIALDRAVSLLLPSPLPMSATGMERTIHDGRIHHV